MRRPNHASRFEGIAKTNLQASRASDTETLQSQVNKAGKKRLSLSGLEILHGRLSRLLQTLQARRAIDETGAAAFLLRLDTGVPDHLAPLAELNLDEVPELRGRA